MNYIESFGAIPSPKDVRDYKAVCKANINTFPEEFSLPMPSVKNQMEIGACVAHALASTIEYFNRTQGDYGRDMSVGFIYGNRGTTDHQGVGMYPRQALDRAQKCGCVPAAKFKYYEEAPEIVDYVQERLVDLLPEAYPFHITSYYQLHDIDDIKASLMQNGPVVFSMNWFADIELQNNIITTNGEPSNTYHAMVIYGWDATGWKIQNSWGITWGDNGRATLPFDVPLTEVWGVVDTYSENMRREQELLFKEKIDELSTKTDKQEAEIERLMKLIAEFESGDMTQADELTRLTDALNQLSEDYNANQQKLLEYANEIQMLNEELLEVKKPFQSNLGKLVAKLLNLLIQIFTKKKM